MKINTYNLKKHKLQIKWKRSSSKKIDRSQFLTPVFDIYRQFYRRDKGWKREGGQSSVSERSKFEKKGVERGLETISG